MKEVTVVDERGKPFWGEGPLKLRYFEDGNTLIVKSPYVFSGVFVNSNIANVEIDSERCILVFLSILKTIDGFRYKILRYNWLSRFDYEADVQ